jgi:single-strand DNA-binding protein
MGRITKDVELKATQAGNSVVTFTIAVDRNYTEKDGTRATDFINCVAWRQTAEFIQKYFGKGSLILLEGEIQTRNYKDKDGKTCYVTEVKVNTASFTGEKKQSAQAAPETPPAPQGEDYPF